MIRRESAGTEVPGMVAVLSAEFALPVQTLSASIPTATPRRASKDKVSIVCATSLALTASATASAMATLSTVKLARAAKWPTGLPVKSLRLSNIGQRSVRQSCKLMFHRVAYSAFVGDGECCASVFRGSGRMPAYQSIPEFDLSEKYHLKAVRCERCAKNASDQNAEQE
jgi:hypothetical protein